MKVIADEHKCCGAGQCVMVAPDVFDQRDEDGIVVVLESEPVDSQHVSTREAASMCPTAAITVVDDEPRTH
ncbi:ferredoxin [Rhodococcoides yunnanense]|uniref:ferredoxin n=1 Tax=Rhodococcoides yunnanense TaxID=278209 RepID=UPI000934C799|nr:ferredoxin [Rhodococcus yunnanensis]